MTLFSPAELRLLRLSDRLAEPERTYKPRHLGRPPLPRGPRPGYIANRGLGRLSEEQARAAVAAGASCQELATTAGVGRRAVSRWKRKMGLARKWERQEGAA